MRENQTLIDDLMSLGSSALGNLLGARHEMRAQARHRIESFAQRFDLVTRAEFDAAFAMLAKARTMQEDLNERLSVIEAKLNLSSAKARKNLEKSSLPSVKNRNQRKKRG